MERLTIRNSDGSVSQPTDSTFEKVFNRLAEYEDLGFYPDEIRRKLTRTPDDYDITRIFRQFFEEMSRAKAGSEEGIEKKYCNALRALFSRGYGGVFTVDNFIKYVEEGYFVDYDGTGYFATEDGTHQQVVRCSASWLRKNRKDYPFVLWYNS